MGNDIINKYLKNKQKTLLSYAVVLYKVYEVDEVKLWKSEEEFEKIFSLLLKIYLYKYYMIDPVKLKQMNVKNMEENEFKLTLSLAVIMDYYKEDYEKLNKNYKKSLYNLTVMLYIVTNIDKKISFYKEDVINTKEIVEKLNDMFKDVLKDINTKKNPFFLEILANKIKEFEKKEIRFFESLKDSESYILFKKYDINVFYVDYFFELQSLMNYDSQRVINIYREDKFKEQYLPLIYDLTSITILKLYSNDCQIPRFIVPVTTNFIKTNNSRKLITKLFSQRYINNNIILCAYNSDYLKNRSVYNFLDNLGIELSLYIDNSEIIIDYKKLSKDIKYYIRKEFIELNPQFEEYAKDKDIQYKILEEEIFNEDQIIKENVVKEN